MKNQMLKIAVGAISLLSATALSTTANASTSTVGGGLFQVSNSIGFDPMTIAGADSVIGFNSMTVGGSSKTTFATGTSESHFALGKDMPTISAIAPSVVRTEQRVRDIAYRDHIDSYHFRNRAGYDLNSRLVDRVSLWASYNHFETETDEPGAMWDTDAHIGFAGVDIVLTPNATLGGFLNYGGSDTSSMFNWGSADSHYYGCGGYIVFRINQFLTADAMLGMSHGETDNYRMENVATFGSQDNESWYHHISIAAEDRYGDVGVSARVGYSYSDTNYEGYRDNLGVWNPRMETELGQLQVGVGLEYYTKHFIPNVSLTYVDDIDRDIIWVTPTLTLNDGDHDDFVIGAGVDIVNFGDLEASIGGSIATGRDSEDEAWGVGLQLNYGF